MHNIFAIAQYQNIPKYKRETLLFDVQPESGQTYQNKEPKET